MSDPFEELPPVEPGIDFPPTDPEPETPPPAAVPGAPVENIKFAWYDLVTGEIQRVGHAAEQSLDANEAMYPELGFILGDALPETHMVDVAAEPPVIVSRPTFSLTVDKTSIAADGIDTATISGIPADTLVTLQPTGDFPSADEVVTTGSTTLATVYPVPHTLTFELFPYQATQRVIDAV
jgi:hypothetical protein